MSSRLSKLKAMSASEVGTRLFDRVYASWERRTLRQVPWRESLRRGLRPDLARSTNWEAALLEARPSRSVRFFASFDSPASMRGRLEASYPTENVQTLRHADAARAHRVEFFGQEHDLGSPIDWHCDPVSGQRWPLVYHGDVPTGGGNDRLGDVKDVWEAGRHQWVVDLAKASFLTGRREYSDTAFDVVKSWARANPYGVGVHWAGPLEPAYRALSWLWVYHLTRDALEKDPEFHLEWLAAFADHGRFLSRHLELFASPYNHLIGEATALYCLGLLFPEFSEAASWRKKGRAVLESRLGEQFYPDGGSVEQATLYHHATLGFYLLAALLGRRNNDEFSAQTWQSIERGTDFSMRLLQPDGRLPAIGDTDDAKPIRMEHRDIWDFRHFLSAGAVLFAREDFKSTAGRFHEDALWLLGPSGFEAFEKLGSRSPAQVSSALTKSGYVVLRSGWDAQADYVCFDCGEQAGGLRTDDIPSAAHGHADCLSVVACLAGKPVLVDAGFYTYNRDRDWERFLRETAAHNTVRIDGRDQATHLEKMAWAEVPTAVLESSSVEGPGGWAVASHDGYARRADGVTHRRAVWLRPGAYLAILDELSGSGSHQFEVIFQLAPGLDCSLANGVLRIGERGALATASTCDLVARVSTGGASPGDGWVAPGLGVKHPAARVVCSGSFQNFARVLTVVTADAQLRRLADAQTLPGAKVLALEVAGADYIDVIASPLRDGGADVCTDGLIAAWRTQGTTTFPGEHVGGTFAAALPPQVLVGLLENSRR